MNIAIALLAALVTILTSAVIVLAYYLVKVSDDYDNLSESNQRTLRNQTHITI